MTAEDTLISSPQPPDEEKSIAGPPDDPISGDTPSDDEPAYIPFLRFGVRVVVLLIAFVLARGLIRSVLSSVALTAAADPTFRITPEAALDWSHSWAVSRGNPVREVAATRMGNTLTLIIAGMTLTAVLTIIRITATRISNRQDMPGVVRVAGRIWMALQAGIPVFAFGLLAIILFSLKFKEWGLPSLPSGGVESLRSEIAGTPLDRFIHLILPTITMSLLPAVLTSQAVVRYLTPPNGAERGMLQGMLKLFAALFRQIGGLVSAAILVEILFAYNGLGRLFFEAMFRLDVPMAFGMMIAFTWIILIGRLLSEVFELALSLVNARATHASAGSTAVAEGRSRIWMIAGLALLIIPVLCALSGVVTDFDALYDLNPNNAHLSPGQGGYLLGTDEVGRDVAARLRRAAFVTSSISVAGSFVALIVASLVGALVGFMRERRSLLPKILSEIILLPVEIPLFIPATTMLMLYMLVFRSDSDPFAAATLAVGLLVILVPRAIHAFAVLWKRAPAERRALMRSVAAPGALLLASTFFGMQWLSAAGFMGFGMIPTIPSLGNMMTRVQDYMFLNPLLAIWPSLMLWILLFCIYVAADAVARDFETGDHLVSLNM